MIGDDEATYWPAHRRARAGLARTFQIVKLFKEFTVRENVEVAAISAGGCRAARHGSAPRHALAQVGIAHLADVPASILPQGEERRVEIARALATTHRRFSCSTNRARA